MILKVDDVVIEILVRLPLKPLLRSKCVCKWWNHLISNYSRQNPQHYVSGFFLQKFLFLELYSKLEFITCGGEAGAAPQPSVSFIEDDKGICIQSSCNGLLLCSSFRCHEEDRNYYICKPTTKQYQQLPKPKCKVVFGISIAAIAYDPCMSAYYKIICICDSKLSANHRRIKIYDSATGSWRVSLGNPVIVYDDVLFSRGVFWRGALHWVGRGKSSLRVEVEAEHMVAIPMPPIPKGRSERRVGYFGESGGHLYLIEVNEIPSTSFDVMEMDSEYSGWFVKYKVDLGRVAFQFPSMVRKNVQLQHIHRHMFSVLQVIDQRQQGEGGDEEDESYMVLYVPGYFVKYKLKDGDFMQLGNPNFSYEAQCADERWDCGICGRESIHISTLSAIFNYSFLFVYV